MSAGAVRNFFHFSLLSEKKLTVNWAIACGPGDRLNRATASEELKMMGKFFSALSLVPHSYRQAKVFPTFHSHTVTGEASSYFPSINKSMSPHATHWKCAKLSTRMLHSRTLFFFTFVFIHFHCVPRSHNNIESSMMI